MDAKHNPNLVLGTAGHIDHGKSTLVMALTGTDPDTLAEEKKRGITIELGFAQLELPDGRKMTVVDVPGHEKFVRQMIVGAAGVDVALLVIAADDGVMPQTTEHVAVLQTLGIKSCVVALTKIDMVDRDWLDLVEDDVRSFLANTPYANARIVRCSARTGEGVEDVRQAIADACDEAPQVHRSKAFRQPVHKVFTVKGAGTIVTGVVWSGTARVNDTVEVLPSGKRARIRSVQVHGQQMDEAPAGNCVAINLADVKNGEVSSGDFIATPNTVHMTDQFDCYFTYIDTAGTGKPLVSGVQMHIAHGAREILGRVLFADGFTQLGSGQSCYAQIRLDEPLAMSCYDRFIARTYSPVRVAGGGQVLFTHPKRRTNLTDQERCVLDAVNDGDFQKAVELELAAQHQPCTAAELAFSFGTDAESMSECLQNAAAGGRAIPFGNEGAYFTTPETQERMIGKMEQTLIAFHREFPAEPGMKKETLRQQCFPRMDADRFDILVGLAQSQGKVAINKGLVGHSSAQAKAEEEERRAEEALLGTLREAGITPPELKEAAQENSLTMPLARRAIAALVAEGKVYKVTPELYYESSTMNTLKDAVARLCSREGGAGIGELREAMGVSRKRAVSILEALDKEEFTVRVDDMRFLKQPRPSA